MDAPLSVFHLNVSSMALLRDLARIPEIAERLGVLLISTVEFRRDAARRLDEYVQPCRLPPEITGPCGITDEDMPFRAALRAKSALKSSIAASREMDLSGLLGRIFTETLAMLPSLRKIIIIDGRDLWETPQSCSLDPSSLELQIVKEFLKPEYLLHQIYDLEARSRTRNYINMALYVLDAQSRITVIDYSRD